MKFRRAIAWFAVLGVLLHAELIARHHVSSQEAFAQDHGFLLALSDICRADSGAMQDRASGASEADPVDKKADCPPCAGMMPAAAPPLVIGLPFRCEPVATMRAALFDAPARHRVTTAWFPPRGPPPRA